MDGPTRGSSLHGWSVGARLLIINGLLAVALMVVGVIAWRALTQQSRAMAELANISRAARYHQDADVQQSNIRADINSALSGRSENAADRGRFGQSLEDDAKELRIDLLTLEKLELPADLVDTESKVRTLADAFLGRSLELGHQILQDPGATATLLASFNESHDALDDAMLAQTAALSRHIVQANDDAAAAEFAAKRRLLTAGILTNIIVALLVAGMSRSIRRSLRSVRDVAQALADGQLNARNLSLSSDELGELALANNHMADHLNEVIAKLRSEAERDAFGSQLIEALEMADTETETYAVLTRAMSVISPDLPTELLLADSSRAHLERATAHGLAGAPGCSVESPFSCMAVRRGNPVVFEDSDALNACTRLRGRACGSVSAVCVPVSFMGRALGVLHAAGKVGSLPSARQIAQLTTLGIQAGARIGTVRAFHSTQHQAATDALTGLNNRRSAERFAGDLVRDGTAYAIAMADLDHFKVLNDSRGHEAGDQALRRFATILRNAMRDGDLAARWGGEEFVLILPKADSQQALEVVERIRDSLAEASLDGGVPVFTSSFGISDSTMNPQFEELLRIADEALYRAKDAGRDRAMVGRASSSSAVSERRSVEHPVSFDAKLMAQEAER